MIEVTTKEDVVQTIDDGDIYYIKPALHECTIYFVDGSSLRVKQTFEEVSRRIKDAE